MKTTLMAGGKVYTKIISDASWATLIPIIKCKFVLDVPDFHHFHINHSKLFADRHSLINGIENSCAQAKRRMRKLNSVSKDQFSLCLEEYEWYFNNSDPSGQLLFLRQWVKCHLE
tara:strand:- start:113 stop:457 length:345 start_codon:yes stop_codon:yes gene_type:complete